ncbi:MAG TPA: low molecular weight phosphatase family protein [Pirellulales bacterium]
MEVTKRVLFLCTGNYYRSRFAEIFFNWHARQRGMAWQAASRGLMLVKENVGPLSCHTTARLTALGISFDEHLRLPQAAARDDFETAQLIVAVKRAEHHPLLESQFPQWLPRVEFWDIHDVDCANASEAMPELEAHVLRLLDRLVHEAAA